MNAPARPTLSDRLFEAAARVQRAGVNDSLATLNIPQRIIDECGGIVTNGDELRIVAILYQALLNVDTKPSKASTVLGCLHLCFGSVRVIHGIGVLKHLILTGSITVQDVNGEDLGSMIGLSQEFLGAKIGLSNGILARIEELEFAQEDVVTSHLIASDAADSDLAEDDDDLQDDGSFDDGPDGVVNELNNKRTLMHEEFVAGGSGYIPDAAIADTFDQIINICSSDVRSIIQSYGISGVASHYRPTRHDRVVILLSGAPGTGKTAAAYALAQHLGRRIFVTTTEQLKSPYNGMFERNTRRLFREFKEMSTAEAAAPMLLIDECEGLFARRGEDIVNSTIARTENIVTDILLQEIETFEGILVLTTNTPKVFDPAFDRRIDYKMHLDGTSADTQRRVWQLRLPATMPGADAIDVESLVAEFDLTPAEITLIVHNTVRTIVARNPQQHKLTQESLVRECCAYRGLVKNSKRPHTIPFGFV